MNDLERLFPALDSSRYAVTSPEDIRYNCVAWAVKDTDRWWWPDEDSYWPEGIARDESIAAFVEAFRDAGFVPCDDSHLEEGCEKIAICSAPDNIPTHVARQLQSGLWTSKLGQLQDIQHRLEDLIGTVYGRCQHFLRRERSHDE
jgi:hypothetical protein